MILQQTVSKELKIWIWKFKFSVAASLIFSRLLEYDRSFGRNFCSLSAVVVSGKQRPRIREREREYTTLENAKFCWHFSDVDTLVKKMPWSSIRETVDKHRYSFHLRMLNLHRFDFAASQCYRLRKLQAKKIPVLKVIFSREF